MASERTIFFGQSANLDARPRSIVSCWSCHISRHTQPNYSAYFVCFNVSVTAFPVYGILNKLYLKQDSVSSMPSSSVTSLKQGAWYSRYGDIITVHVNGLILDAPSSTDWGGIQIGTMPVGLRPQWTVQAPCLVKSQYTNVLALEVQTGGTIKIQAFGTSAGWGSGSVNLNSGDFYGVSAGTDTEIYSSVSYVCRQ